MITTSEFADFLNLVSPVKVVAAESWDGLDKPDRLMIVRRLPDLGATHEGLFSRPVFRLQNRGKARDSVGAEDDAFALALEVMGMESMEFNGHWMTSFTVSGWPSPLPTSPDSSRRSMLESSYMVQVSTELAGT